MMIKKIMYYVCIRCQDPVRADEGFIWLKNNDLNDPFSGALCDDYCVRLWLVKTGIIHKISEYERSKKLEVIK